MEMRTFADGIESLSVVEGIVRLELFAYKPGAVKDGQKTPDHVAAGELVTSMAGLMRIHEGITRLLEDMKKRQEAAKAAGSENFPANK